MNKQKIKELLRHAPDDEVDDMLADEIVPERKTKVKKEYKPDERSRARKLQKVTRGKTLYVPPDPD